MLLVCGRGIGSHPLCSISICYGVSFCEPYTKLNGAVQVIFHLSYTNLQLLFIATTKVVHWLPPESAKLWTIEYAVQKSLRCIHSHRHRRNRNVRSIRTSPSSRLLNIYFLNHRSVRHYTASRCAVTLFPLNHYYWKIKYRSASPTRQLWFHRNQPPLHMPIKV